MDQPSTATRPARRFRWLRASLSSCIATLLLAASFPSGGASLADREFEYAVIAYKAGRTSEAFGQFQDLANRGDVDSARIALFMSAYGPLLYGKQWDVLPRDTAYWTSLVRNSGTSARVPPDFVPLATGTPRKPRQVATTAPATALRSLSTTAR